MTTAFDESAEDDLPADEEPGALDHVANVSAEPPVEADPPIGTHLPPVFAELRKQMAEMHAADPDSDPIMFRPSAVDTRGFVFRPRFDPTRAFASVINAQRMATPALDLIKTIGASTPAPYTVTGLNTAGALASLTNAQQVAGSTLDFMKAFAAPLDAIATRMVGLATSRALTSVVNAQPVACSTWDFMKALAAPDAISTRMVGLDTSQALASVLNSQLDILPSLGTSKTFGAAFDVMKMLGPAVDFTKTIATAFDTMRLFEAISRSSSLGSLNDVLSPLLAAMLAASPEQDAETLLVISRPWSSEDRFAWQCYVAVVATLAMIYCGVTESAFWALLGLGAGSVGFSTGLSPWHLAGKVYDRVYGR